MSEIRNKHGYIHNFKNKEQALINKHNVRNKEQAWINIHNVKKKGTVIDK